MNDATKVDDAIEVGEQSALQLMEAAKIVEGFGLPSLASIFRGQAIVQRRVNQASCTHAGWTFEKDGRCCRKCGTFVVDFGD